MWSRSLGNLQDFLHWQVTLLGCSWPNVIGLICLRNERNLINTVASTSITLRGQSWQRWHTMATCMEWRSASLYTATERTPIFFAVRITRQAISPLLAMRTFSILPCPRGKETWAMSDDVMHTNWDNYNASSAGSIYMEMNNFTKRHSILLHVTYQLRQTAQILWSISIS